MKQTTHRTKEQKKELIAQVNAMTAGGKMTSVAACKQLGIRGGQLWAWKKKLGNQPATTDVEFITPSPTTTGRPRGPKVKDTSKAFMFMGTPSQITEIMRTI